MPYLGNQAGNRFVASKAATQFSGDGSTTAFTLEHAVGSDEDILVSVDGVIQEPSVAYAVSNGTTLTFTAAPSSNSGNNIFVYYLFRTVGTVDHPSTSSLQATDGTFSSTLNVTGETTLATHLNMGDNDIIKVGDSADLQIYHDGSNSVILDNGTGEFLISTNGNFIRLGTSTGEAMIDAVKDGASTLYHDNSAKLATTSSGVNVTGNVISNDGSNVARFQFDNDNQVLIQNDTAMNFYVNGNNSLKIDSNGIINKPYNPSFRAMGTTGAYITTSPVQFNSVSGSGGHNIGNHYNTSNYRFTAPVAGRYLFHVHMGIINITANNGLGYPYIRINGTSVAYSYYQFPASGTYVGAFITQIFELSASDYVDVTFGGGNSTYYGNYTELSFSGCLIG